MAVELELWQFLAIMGGFGLLFFMLLGVIIAMCRPSNAVDTGGGAPPQQSDVTYSSMVRLPPLNQL